MANSATTISITIAILCLLVALHPFLTYPFSLRVFFRRRAVALGQWSPDQRPSVAICLSAYNEEAVILNKVESLLRMKQAYGNATIHVYTDGCSDDTVKRLEPYRDQIDLVVSDQRNGKTYGLNVLIARSSSELLMFTDANVDVPDDGLIRLAAPFVDPNCGCATAQLKYVNAKDSPTSFAGSLYWRIEEAVKLLESNTVGMVGVDGASFVVRRDAYRPAPPNLIDDLYVTLSILIEGMRVVRAPNITVFERSAVATGEEYRRKVRIACQAMNVHKVMWSGVKQQSASLIYSYVSHRLIKWMMPYLLACSGLAFLAAIGFAYGFAIAAGLLALMLLTVTIGALVNIPVVSLLSTIAISFIGVGQGVAMSWLSNQSFTTWEPVESVRQNEVKP
jgi:cellulose synthase/poly-beta-1,6-N-acetylglucosamine synthase-like glycosyltransferase